MGVTTRSAAGEELGHLARAHSVQQLVDADPALNRGQPKFRCQRQDRIARDALEDGSGELGGNEFILSAVTR